jgi:hypothetical protein
MEKIKTWLKETSKVNGQNLPSKRPITPVPPIGDLRPPCGGNVNPLSPQEMHRRLNKLSREVDRLRSQNRELERRILLLQPLSFSNAASSEFGTAISDLSAESEDSFIQLCATSQPDCADINEALSANGFVTLLLSMNSENLTISSVDELGNRQAVNFPVRGQPTINGKRILTED